jgi:hypothetical protein
VANSSKVTWAPPSDWGGPPLGYYLIAVTNPGVKDTYHAETQAGWIVLGAYCTEDDVYCECETSEEWDKFLQDELVRLAEKKGLGSEATLFVASERLCLEGTKE